MEFLSLIWNEALIRPMVNSLVVIYLVLFDNFGLSILVFTATVRILTFPLTVKQLRQTRAMSQLAPRIQEIQKKHAGDRQRVSQETFRLYREHGVNPAGCLGPLVVQMPILIGLYWALIRVLPSNPENLVELSQLLYSWLPAVHRSIPINSIFLTVDLSAFVGNLVSPVNFVVTILVGGSMWVQQKMATMPTTDAAAAEHAAHDALDVPHHVCRYYLVVPHGACPLLDILQSHRHCNPIQNHRLRRTETPGTRGAPRAAPNP